MLGMWHRRKKEELRVIVSLGSSRWLDFGTIF